MDFVKCIITKNNIKISNLSIPINPPISIQEFSQDIELFYNRPEILNEQKLKEIGEKLFQRVFSDNIFDLYRSTSKTLALDLPSELAMLPWELLYDGSNWVAKTRGIIRIVDTQQASPEIIPKPGALRVLAAISEPLIYDASMEQPSPVGEGRIHIEAFRNLSGSKYPAEIKIQNHITNDILSREVSENYHVLHIKAPVKIGRLVLENRHGAAVLAEETWLKEQIVTGLRGGLRLIVISGSAPDEMQAFVSSIMSTGLPVVICLLGNVSVQFIKEFYGLLGKGKAIDEALLETRINMANNWQIEPCQWAMPAIFLSESIIESKSSLCLIDSGMVNMMGSPKVSIIEQQYPRLDYMMAREEKFVGRYRELNEVLRYIDPESQEGAQVVCLYGDDGTGKTAIAIEAARRMAGWFHDVIWLSNIISHKKTGPASFINTEEGFLKALLRKNSSLTNEPYQDYFPKEDPGNFLSIILRRLKDGRRKLLVLDGMEQMSNSNLIKTFMANLPFNCRAIVTSQVPLDINEKQIQIKPMDKSHASQLLANTDEIDNIIHFTGGYPLALCLFASQMAFEDKPINYMLDKLQKAKGNILQYIFDNSLELAGKDGRTIIAISAIFYPTISRKAIKSISGLSDNAFEQAIDQVLRLSLLESYDNGKYFGLHPLFRSKALDLLENDIERERFYQEATKFFLEFVRATAPMTQISNAVKAFASQLPQGLGKQKIIEDAAIQIFAKPAKEMLEINLLNCFIIMDWMLEHNHLDMLDDIFKPLNGFLMSYGYLEEAAYYLEKISNSRKKDKRRYAESLILLGVIYERQDKLEKALKCYNEALEATRESQEKTLEANILSGLGATYWKMNNHDEAIEYLGAARGMFQSLKDEMGEANALNSLGDVYEQAGNFDNAINAFNDAEKIFDKLNERISRAEVLNKLASCYINKGQIDDGIEYYNRAMKLYIDIGNKDGQSNVLEQLGTIYLNQMNIPQAIQNYQNSLNIKQELGDRLGRQRILSFMALAYANQKQWMKSAISCVESFQIASQFHSTGVISSLKSILSVSKIMLKENQFAFPAQLAQQLSQTIQNVVTSEDQMRTALAISHGVFTIIGFMAACESRKDRDIYKEALELARSLDERTGAALKLLEWVEEIGL